MIDHKMRGGPLQGVRVVELTKVWAGPYIGKLLAFLGAEVIRVESEASLDVTRTYGVADIADIANINRAPGFQAVNPQKLSVQIDMKTKQGIGLILDLIGKSDILIENLRPGAVKRLGLGYDNVKAIKPDIIYTSMGMHGSDGPLAYQTGYAPCFAALGGLSSLVGYEGEPPAGMNVRYADSTFGTAAAYATMVALLHRRRTGVGQFIDVSAVESMTSMLGDAVMDFALNGVIREGDGNRHAEMAPHGVYPCRDGEWISIAVSSDAAWQALAAAMELSDSAFDTLSFETLSFETLSLETLSLETLSLETLAQRKANEVELDRLVAAWTQSRDAAELVALLQQRGVAAAKSQSSVDLVTDQHLWASDFFHPVVGNDGVMRPIVGPGWKMSRGAAITTGAPRLGEHNAYVFGDILGLSTAEQLQLTETGIAR